MFVRKFVFLFVAVTVLKVPVTESASETSLPPDLYYQSVVNDSVVPSNASVTQRFTTPCQTPNKESGYCVYLEKCPILAANGENANFLNASNCLPSHIVHVKPKVCCGTYGDFIDPFPEECGKQQTLFPNRIVGGTETELGEFPWMVRLIHKRDHERYKTSGCSAILIAANYVLTAAHCVQNKIINMYGPIFEVHLGEHNTRTDTDCKQYGDEMVCADKIQVIRVGKIIQHPEYDNMSLSQYDDIAIITLRQPANFTDFVQPICISSKPTSEREMWLAGWGATESRERSHIKLKVNVRRANFTYCEGMYKKVRINVRSSQLCAGGDAGKDSCSGDSGGPLMVESMGKWFAEGIVSFGLECGLEYWPAVYTNVPTYYEWVRNEIEQHRKTYLKKHCEQYGTCQIYPRKSSRNVKKAKNGRQCTTPNGESATCISIYSCNILIEALKTRDPEKLSFIRQSHCGTEGQTPLVCCGTSVQMETSPRKQKTKSPLLPREPDCGSHIQNRIIGGLEVDLTEFPWLALLFYRRHDGLLRHYCGGVLINSKYVLTAAHCVTGERVGRQGNLTHIRLGEWDTTTDPDCVGSSPYLECNDPVIDVPIEKIISHPEYQPNSPQNKIHDIALIRLSRSVRFSDSIQPICLPTNVSETDFSPNQLWVVGWGATESSTKSNKKRIVRLPTVNKDDCAKIYSRFSIQIDDSQLCAGGETGKDSCNGDSGGPLMSPKHGSSSWYLRGIVSFGFICSSTGGPSIYTKVAHYLDWIQDNVES